MRRRTKIILFILLLIIVLGLLGFIFINYFFTPTIKLEEGNSYTINYNDKYKEPGYKAIFRGENLTDEVKVSGKVNSKKLGNYKITYYVDNGIIPKKVTRVVKVRDIEKPTIKLTSTKDIIACPGKTYKEESFTATDNYDGNITDKVKVTKEENLIRYAVADTSGNHRVVTRNIKYMDKTNPVINLSNGVYTNVYLNEEYNGLEYEATDNCDGDITKNVIVNGSVNPNVSGKYELTYKVTDSNNNKTEVKQIVNVVRKNQPGTIYLTFDDGPREGITNVILDILKEEGVKATFFVTTGGPDELIKRIHDEGHSIGLHTSSHNYSYIYSSSDNYFQDLEAVHQRVLNVTGFDSRIIRFPGGSSNTISKRYNIGIMTYLTREVLNRNYKYYDWNIDCGDTGNARDKDKVYQNVVNNISLDKVNIILMHDIKTYTRDALQEIIKYGKENGYVFDKIQNDTEMMTQKVNN